MDCDDSVELVSVLSVTFFSLLCPGEKESVLKSFLSRFEGQIQTLLVSRLDDL